MRKTSLLVFAIMLFVAVTVSGCDTNKDERALLLKQLTDVEANLTRLNERLTEVSQDLEVLPSEIKQHTDGAQQYSQRRTKLQDDLGVYLLDHKMASVALIAAAGGAATVINDNTDQDTKDVLRFAGFIGALYCLDNSGECADVAARVLYFGSQIESENKNIAEARSKLSAGKSLLQERKQEHASLGGMIAKKMSERDALKQKHDSLSCGLCF